MPKRQLPIQAGVIINRLRLEASIERQRAVFEIDDDVPAGSGAKVLLDTHSP